MLIFILECFVLIVTIKRISLKILSLLVSVNILFLQMRLVITLDIILLCRQLLLRNKLISFYILIEAALIANV